jgi:hypothetical protein
MSRSRRGRGGGTRARRLVTLHPATRAAAARDDVSRLLLASGSAGMLWWRMCVAGLLPTQLRVRLYLCLSLFPTDAEAWRSQGHLRGKSESGKLIKGSGNLNSGFRIQEEGEKRPQPTSPPRPVAMSFTASKAPASVKVFASAQAKPAAKAAAAAAPKRCVPPARACGRGLACLATAAGAAPQARPLARSADAG